MLAPASSGYQLLMRSITTLTGIDYSNLRIRLPSHILTTPFRFWFDPTVWRTRDPTLISLSVYTRLGHRVPVTMPSPSDDTEVTRGIFITSHQPIRYNDMRWPFNVKPQAFLSVKAQQRTVHYHAILVMPYFAKSPIQLWQKISTHHAEVQRIKTDWKHMSNYLTLQSIEILDSIMTDPKVSNWKDHMRCKDRAAVVTSEFKSNGLPLAFDGKTPRSPDWRVIPGRPVKITDQDCSFLSPHEIYTETMPGRLFLDYRGQMIIRIRVNQQNVISITLLCAAYVII
jgi:hypothetical protein